MLPLSLLSLAFLWTVLRSGGVDLSDTNLAVIAFALLALALYRRPQAPRLESRFAWPLALLASWVVFQLVPLPVAAIRLLSPSRAALAAGLDPAGFLLLSAAPAATLAEFQRLAGAILVFLIVRELAFRFSDRPWTTAAPLLITAALEAALGLVQVATAAGSAAADGARGTYTNRDHFAGLMEMTLPFFVMLGVGRLWRARRRYLSPLRPALAACAAFSLAALVLLASIHSLSRMGFISALFSLALLAASALRRKRWLLAAPAAALALFIYLPPGRLIARFADLSTPDKLASQDRLEVWRETLPLVRAYWISGVGLGTYESAFMSYKHQAPAITDNYAHNDYLQYLAELGAPGALSLLAFLAAFVYSAARAAARHAHPAGRALALASLASMGALLLHSLVDFNTYIPANAFAISWVAALGISAMYSSKPRVRAGTVVLYVTVSSV